MPILRAQPSVERAPDSSRGNPYLGAGGHFQERDPLTSNQSRHVNTYIVMLLARAGKPGGDEASFGFRECRGVVLRRGPVFQRVNVVGGQQAALPRLRLGRKFGCGA